MEGIMHFDRALSACEAKVLEEERKQREQR